MEMTIPVTLIVKAPNQQIEDQTVKCELSWTISKLKGHLSEVYPSKPTHDEQKLIYSGQLLPDTVVLKDVLRNYDGQDTHTVHLVCAPSNTFKFEPPKPAPKMTDSQPTEMQEDDSSTGASSSGLHQRNVNLNTSESVPDFRTVWTSISQSYTTFPDPNQYAMYGAIMQQAYAQYINQYMQMVTSQMPQRPADQQRDPEPVAPEPINPGEAMLDEQDGDEPQPDRDWLDWFYVLSRVMVLFCIVYFYSSPLRFALVLLLGISLYLYQTGFFRLQVLNNNDVPRPENNNVQNTQPPSPNQSENLPLVIQRPTMLNIMWTFFTTFFASLIPEIPNAI